MLPQITMHANVLASLGEQVNKRLFVASGWSIPDDTDTGISVGEGLEVGLGYIEMDVRNNRTRQTFELRGGYVEVGVGLGEISQLAPFVNAVKKLLPVLKSVKPQSDLIVAPGGTIGELIMGPFETRGSLFENDFNRASWVYVNVGAELAVPAGNIGLIFLISPWAAAALALVPGGAAAIPACLNCIAWAPYWGIGVGLGAGAKIGARFIQDVQMNPK